MVLSYWNLWEITVHESHRILHDQRTMAPAFAKFNAALPKWKLVAVTLSIF